MAEDKKTWKSDFEARKELSAKGKEPEDSNHQRKKHKKDR